MHSLVPYLTTAHTAYAMYMSTCTVFAMYQEARKAAESPVQLLQVLINLK
jgi:hypothetical protein